VEVGPQLLIPGVQDQREADLASQLLAAELQEGLRRRVEEQLQQRPLVPLAEQDQRVELVRQRKHVMEVGHRQQFVGAGLDPGGRGRALALGTVPVAATVIDVPLVPATLAPQAVASQRRRAAGRDRADRLALGRPQRTRFLQGRAVTAEQVRQLATARCRRRCRT